MYLAHKTDENSSREQELITHCENTAQYALERINIDNFIHTIRLAGWLHDLGKYSLSYQEYIRKAALGQEVRRGSVNHTFAGVIYILEKYHNEDNSKYEKRTSELIAYAVGAHHGLFDTMNYKDENGFEHRLRYSKDSIEYEEVIERFYQYYISEKQVEQEFLMAVSEVEGFSEKVIAECRNWYLTENRHEEYNPSIELHYVWGMLIRMLVSAVMYGDRTDTAEFMQDISQMNRRRKSKTF